MRVTILGSGSSSGVPGIGVGWGACDPKNPKNRRLRPSILLEWQGRTILIDTSPDLREQLLRNGTERLDATIYTHAHADHLHGIDDLRGVNRALNAPLDIYADAHTLKTIKDRFPYVLEPLRAGSDFYYKPTLIAHEIVPGEAFEVAGLPVQSFEQDHGHTKTVGFRFGSFAYTTDLVELPEVAFGILGGVDTWLLGVFTDVPHWTHVHVERALEWRARVQPRRCVFSHLGPRLDYTTLAESLPEGVEPAFDFMTLEIPDN
jgi:phosphoribosyl 1,2-cyclic phosphate phosphodiesterase